MWASLVALAASVGSILHVYLCVDATVHGDGHAQPVIGMGRCASTSVVPDVPGSHGTHFTIEHLK